jgi:hypothetical protein
MSSSVIFHAPNHPERFALVFREAIPVQSTLGARAAQLWLAKPHPFLAASLSVLREGQQAVRLRAAGNCRRMEITCSSFNSKRLMTWNHNP